MLGIQIIMPSEGDMAVLDQQGGSILLQPVFYGGDCAGPHIRIVDVDEKTNKVKNVTGKFRLRIKSDGKIEIKKGGTAEEDQAKE